MAAQGRTDEVVREYESFLTAKSRAAETARAEGRSHEEAEGAAAGPARLTAVRLLGGEGGGGNGTGAGEAPRRYRPGDSLAVEIEWESELPGAGFHVGIGVNRVDEVEVLSFATHLDGREPVTGTGAHRLRLEVPALPLLKGLFTLYVFLLDEDGLHVYDRRILLGAFEMESPSYVFGMIAAEHRWRGAGDAEPRVSVERN